MEVSCLELALEGERLCKAGDYQAGVSFFQAAIQVGTEDLQVLSAIYSQLGNAYFHLHDYVKALEFHRHDLTLTRTIGDMLGEAKASGNLGNTLKVLERFDEAVLCCQRHLDIARDVGDKVGEARALYNFGNVYHAKGKSICRSGAEPGDFPEDVTAALRKASEYYQANLELAQELGDRAAQGRTLGNLGNTHYLLGNFHDAVQSHQQRLLIAKEFGDRSAERRAYCNLGNTYIFLGDFEVAAQHYKRTLQLARQLKDRALEAQACYSLGNSYTLLRDYERAVDYHLKHLIIAQDLNDRVGEGRACWSLGNAHTALGNHDQAVHFAEKHLEICKETGDRSGELTARMNVTDLQTLLGLSYGADRSALSNHEDSCRGTRGGWSRRHSMDNLELIKLTPDNCHTPKWSSETAIKPAKRGLGKSSSKLLLLGRLRRNKLKAKVFQDAANALDERSEPDALGDEAFLDLLSRFQSDRMDDQRCSVREKGGDRLSLDAGTCSPPAIIRKSASESADVLGRRPEDRASAGGSLPGLRLDQNSNRAALGLLMANDAEPDDRFFDMLLKCQGSRLDEQRCAWPAVQAPTVPDEDFFSLIMRSQAKRMDEQRVAPPSSSSSSSSN